MMVMRMACHGLAFLPVNVADGRNRSSSFVASFSQHRGRCVQKQGNTRTKICWRVALYVLALALNVSPRRYVPVSPMSLNGNAHAGAAREDRCMHRSQLGSPEIRTKADARRPL
jgi:hypothetical protein